MIYNFYQKTLKELIFFFVSTLIGSTVYFVLRFVLASRTFSFLVSFTIVIILIVIYICISFKKKSNIVGLVDVFQNSNVAPTTLEILNNANNSVEFMGISARTLFSSEAIEETVRKKIKEGVSFKFLLLDPDSKYVYIKAKDEEDNPEAWKHDIRSSLARLKKIKQETKEEKIEIRIYDLLPIWRTIFIDDKLGYISYYPHGHRAEFAPVFITKNKIKALYFPIRRTFLYYWEHAKEA